MHAVVALALPAVEAFDLAIPVSGCARRCARPPPGARGWSRSAPVPSRWPRRDCLPTAGPPRTGSTPTNWPPATRHFTAQTGMAPLRWLTVARVREARRLLEATDLPVEVIAARCGLGAAANLRVHLARDAGVTPTAYRAAYQGRVSPIREAGS